MVVASERLITRLPARLVDLILPSSVSLPSRIRKVDGQSVPGYLFFSETRVCCPAIFYREYLQVLDKSSGFFSFCTKILGGGRYGSGSNYPRLVGPVVK